MVITAILLDIELCGKADALWRLPYVSKELERKAPMSLPSFQQLMFPALQSSENAGVSEESASRWAISWATAKARQWWMDLPIYPPIVIDISRCGASVRARRLERK